MNAIMQKTQNPVGLKSGVLFFFEEPAELPDGLGGLGPLGFF